MSRYKVTGDWSDEKTEGTYTLQVADITDTRNGQLFRDGAYRVVNAQTRKPYKAGKGGTVPFYGEMAWASGERLLSDLYWEARNRRD